LAAKRYSIEFAPTALRDLESLPRDARKRIGKKIDALAGNPRPSGAVAIKGGEGLLRLRVGTYRVIYKVEDDRLVVLVIRIGHVRPVGCRTRAGHGSIQAKKAGLPDRQGVPETVHR